MGIILKPLVHIPSHPTPHPQLSVSSQEDISLYKNISSPTARAIHKKFAVSMLENNGVNALLCSVKKDIDAEKPKIKEEDIIRYFKVSSFFLKFLGCLITVTKWDELGWSSQSSIFYLVLVHLIRRRKRIHLKNAEGWTVSRWLWISAILYLSSRNLKCFKTKR